MTVTKNDVGNYTFAEYRLKTLFKISDQTVPPGTSINIASGNAVVCEGPSRIGIGPHDGNLFPVRESALSDYVRTDTLRGMVVDGGIAKDLTTVLRDIGNLFEGGAEIVVNDDGISISGYASHPESPDGPVTMYGIERFVVEHRSYSVCYERDDEKDEEIDVAAKLLDAIRNDPKRMPAVGLDPVGAAIVRNIIPEERVRNDYTVTPTSTVPDHPDADGTDVAHPAWWRGHMDGVKSLCRQINELLDGKPPFGFGCEPWESARQRIAALVDKIGTEPLAIDAQYAVERQQLRMRCIESTKDANGIPRRNNVLRNTNSELAILDAISIVEGLGADPLLTAVVTQLNEARETLADYVDTVTPPTPKGTGIPPDAPFEKRADGRLHAKTHAVPVDARPVIPPYPYGLMVNAAQTAWEKQYGPPPGAVDSRVEVGRDGQLREKRVQPANVNVDE